jgi:hypothetical protein
MLSGRANRELWGVVTPAIVTRCHVGRCPNSDDPSMRTVIGCVASCLAIFPAAAAARHFSRPVRIAGPGADWVWTFAVNDRGQAVATNGRHNFMDSPPGKLVRLPDIAIAGARGRGEAAESLTLDSQGRIAAGLTLP